MRILWIIWGRLISKEEIRQNATWILLPSISILGEIQVYLSFLPHNCSQNSTWVLKVAKSSIKLPNIKISIRSLRLLSFLKTIGLVRSLFTEFSTSHCLLNLADLVLRCKVDDCRVEGRGKTLKLSPESTQNTIIIKITNKPFLEGWGIYVELRISDRKNARNIG